MLAIKDLHATLDGKEIIKGLSLFVPPGEVHAVMGPNGSGKSTLSKVLAGYPDYVVTHGEATMDGADLLTMLPEERAVAGLFLGFQYPVEVPGVNNAEFMRMAVNIRRAAHGEAELDPFDFDQMMGEAMASLSMDDKFRERDVNDGYSGGEKKKNEILQMTLLKPRYAILDEIDSGLDIDALRVVAAGVERLRSKERGIILITHYRRLLDYVRPDRIHVMNAGRIVRSGGLEVAEELETSGYITAEVA